MKKRLDAMSASENNPKINATIKCINASPQLFGKIFFVTLDKVELR